LLTAALVLFAVAGVAWISHYRTAYWYRYEDFGTLRERTRFDLGFRQIKNLTVSPDGNRLYVIDEAKTGDGTLHVVDARVGTVVASIALGPGYPVSVCATPDGTQALVTVSRFRGGKGGASTGENRLVVIDTATNTVARDVGLRESSASGVAVAPDGTSTYVTNRAGFYMIRVDTRNGMISIINVPQGPYAMAMHPVTGRLYLVSTRVGKTNRISVVDTNLDRVVESITTDLVRSVSECRAVFTPGGGRLYVANGKDTRVCVIDTDPESATHHQQIAMVETDGNPIFGLSLNATGTLALVLKGDDQILVLDTNAESQTFHQVVDKVRVGGKPVKFCASTPAGKKPTVFVGDREDGFIRVLSPGGY
ncbi:MAG: YncE family protein, partial [Planctomycetota bacterium]